MAELHAGCAAMLGDPTQVHQVMMNLATNAVQAMPKGGVLRVSLHCARFDAPRAAAIGSLSAGEYLVLRVSDTGTGIHDEVLERMFDPFFTTKEVGVGSGLGLSLVHGIANSVGGAIDVGTELGRGSSFTVYLPRSGDAGARGAKESGPLPRGDGQRVLIVDDEEPLVRLAAETLEQRGYAPVGFTSSLSALREFGANPQRFDAILTDERMPGITGSTIIGEVRRMNPSIPILLMSGYVGAAAALRARELGANDVLKKPLLARELATSLARALQL
jgi:CheY-like chemotaxis protein